MQKGFAPMIIIIGILFLVIIGGGLYYFNKSSFSQPTTQKSQINQSVKPSPSSLPSKVSTTVTLLSNAWNLGTKTYSNPKINITFEYPSYFEEKEVDIQKENTEWADKYKNDPNVRHPLYKSSFYTSFSTLDIYPILDELVREYCDNRMTVSVQQYDNPQNMTLYDFIANLHKTYPGDGITETFDTYKKGLTKTQLPKVDSYVFEGIVGENPVKTVYFTNQGKVYTFGLIGNCDTGGQYTKDAEVVFGKILGSIRFQ